MSTKLPGLSERAIATLVVEAWEEAKHRIKRQQREERIAKAWPATVFEYYNRDKDKYYEPHNERELELLLDDTTPAIIAIGGEGGGKSVFGIIKDLERLRRGCNGAMTSPDFEHFKKSLWPEFRRWCPWECVVPDHRRMESEVWEPSKPFRLVFYNRAGGYSSLYCGGMKDPGSWEGPNLNFWHPDEMRHHDKPDALKVIMGRLRIPVEFEGKTIAPQVFPTTTPRKHWLFHYFGPPLGEDADPSDEHYEFKRGAADVVLKTEDNISNLDPEYIQNRGSVLTDSEKRVYLGAEWEDEEDAALFLPTVAWWVANREDIPELTKHEPLVLAGDAGVNNDYFALLGVTRHHDPARRDTDIMVRYTNLWKPDKGAVDFAEVYAEIERLFERFNLAVLTYDPYQFVDMAQRLENDLGLWCDPFNQGKDREVADTALRQAILERRVAHDGGKELKECIQSAGRKLTGQDKKSLRLVKLNDRDKVDLAVCLSMARDRCLRYEF